MSDTAADILESTSLKEGGASASQPAGSRDHVIRVRGLTKVFKDFWGRPKAKAVNNVDFEVRRGEVFGLLGPNGSGKSTTVKMLLGLLNPTRGHIEVFGHSPKHVPTKSRIGYLPEESYLYKYLDSRETLEFFGRLFDLPPGDRRKRAEQLLEMVGLKQVLRRQVGEFSKGMQRRIGLAQALINDPDLVILDEPTAGLDPIGCREVKDLILALARRGKTVILSSHLLSDVEDVCDRVVIYYGGRIQAMGTLKDLLSKPDSLRITTPVLPKEQLEKALEILRNDLQDPDAIRVDNPTQNLESYFLEIVRRARSSETETSGATSGSKVAAYLREGEDETAEVRKRQELLDRLTAGVEDEKPSAPSVEDREAESARQVEAKLEQLALDDSTGPGEAPKEDFTSSPGADSLQEDEANAKLSGLLGGEEDSKDRS